MPILHDVVEELGYIAEEDIAVLASALNLSRADVHGVVSFYHDFRTSPPTAHTMMVCRAEACQALGAERLHDAAQQRAAAIGDVKVQEVFCLGNCALGPSAMLDGRLHGRLDDARLTALTEGWES